MIAGAGGITLAGLALTALVDRRFVAVPAMIGGFLLTHDPEPVSAGRAAAAARFPHVA